MMNANELRIGNYIKSGSGFYEVIALSSNGIEGTTNIGEKVIIMSPSIIYSGIPLTEEWITNFGFKKYQYGNVKKNIQLKLLNRFVNVYFRIEVEKEIYTDWCFIRKIKYIHELQNLYFAITGEELKLTNTPKSEK